MVKDLPGIDDPGGAARTRRQNHYAWAMMILGALYSAPPIISLVQSGFNVHLNWGFSHFVQFYRDLVTPIIDVIQWPLRWLLQEWQLNWTIPQWVKDLQALSFVLAGLFVRGWGLGERQVVRGLMTHLPPPGAARRFASAATSAVVALFLGFFGAGLVLWAERMVAALRWRFSKLRYSAVEEIWLAPGVDIVPGEDRGIRAFRLRAILRSTSATIIAVIAFYFCNALVPQLGTY